jgi:glycosyltransferase involved in cell wall biosynthesis
MKILQVSNFFKASFESGGVARSAYNIAVNLAQLGNDVTVYTTNRSLVDTKVVTNRITKVDGLKVYYFENLRKYFPVRIPPIPYYSLFVARKEVIDFDIIHIHEHRTLLAIIVSYYAKKHNVPYIIQPRGSVPTLNKKKQKDLFDFFFGKKIVRGATKIVASSRSESGLYIDVFPFVKDIDILHIPNGLNEGEYQNIPDKGLFRKKYGISDNSKIVLYLGRVHERKGIDLLLDSFEEIVHKYSSEKVLLIIAGPDDGYLSHLKSLVQQKKLDEKVIFTGAIHGHNKLEAYVDADVFVLPSKNRYESFGNVVLESCACGTPVIVTNNCGVSEWLTLDVGYVIEYNKKQMVEALDKILFDQRISDAFSFNCTELIKNYSWSSVSSELEKIYEGLI